VTDPVDAPEPDFDAYAAIEDPVECARRLTQLARDRGNLKPRFAALRKQRLAEARIRDGRKVSWLADKVGLKQSGVSRLTSALIEGAQA
jgi:hypothetical protein